jgi:glutamate/tyrosine decarboxylase-like PLP-dependent enzyme
MGELFGIGPAHSGAFVTGATMSNLVGLAVAREWLGERKGVRVADAGIMRSATSTSSPARHIPASTRH